MERANLKVSRGRGAASTHHFILPGLLPTRGKCMHSVEEEGLTERLEFLRLAGQCSILVVIAGIVAGLIAA